MEEIILISIKLRPGINNNSNELLRDLIQDAITDVKDFLNYEDAEELPQGCTNIVKELVISRCNRLGSEGIASQSAGGVSETYTEDIPKPLLKKLYKYRKLRW